MKVQCRIGAVNKSDDIFPLIEKQFKQKITATDTYI